MYPAVVPKLWSETIESHRREVREAIVEATAALVAEHGLRGVAMAKVAAMAGIGRATLYKYFPDIESILMAWHEEHVAHHLDQLSALGDRPGPALERLKAVLGAYGGILFGVAHQHGGSDLATLLHQGPHADLAEQNLGHLVQGLLTEGLKNGDVRGDVAVTELAHFCLSAVSGAASLKAEVAVHRLVGITMDGVRAKP